MKDSLKTNTPHGEFETNNYELSAANQNDEFIQRAYKVIDKIKNIRNIDLYSIYNRINCPIQILKLAVSDKVINIMEIANYVHDIEGKIILKFFEDIKASQELIAYKLHGLSSVMKDLRKDTADLKKDTADLKKDNADLKAKIDEQTAKIDLILKTMLKQKQQKQTTSWSRII
jgi:hypothetical protein